MTIKLGVVMDCISTINIHKDTTLAILLNAQKRRYLIYYIECKDLYLDHGKPYAIAKLLVLKNNNANWYEFLSTKKILLSELQVILMRKNPPFNMEFIYSTYILEFAEHKGTLIINKPTSLRDCNEKLFTCCFPHLIPETFVSNNKLEIKKFHKIHQDIIIKPLDAMGGSSVFRILPQDPNINVIIETVTKNETTYCMLQKYLTNIKYGDKRIFIINGIVIPYCLARIPSSGETRGNLAAGGIAKPQILDEKDFIIAKEIAPILKNKGLLFVGLDMIGHKITEINVTSPTGVCELEKFFSISITGIFLDAIEKIIE